MVATPELTKSARAEAARAARREEILSAARHVFGSRGFRGTTIADIAEEAGIALGTVYLYFRSKEEVFGALAEWFAQIITEAASQAPGARSMEDAVRLRVRRVFDACAENRDLVRLVVLNTDPGTAVAERIRNADGLRQRPIATALEAGMANGLVRKGNPQIMARLFSGVVSIAVYQAYVLSDGSDAEAYREGCADMVVAYLTPPVGSD